MQAPHEEATQEQEIFVVMPFGVKEFSLGARALTVDFDAVYNNLIVEAAQSAGFRATRIDEFTAPGPIGDQYLRKLFESAIVIADVTMPNGNVYYELGIRHAVSTGVTLLIAQRGAQLPFDIAHLRVLFYQTDQLAAARASLGQALKSRADAAQNPVRAFLYRLGVSTDAGADSATFAQDLASRIQRAKTVEQLVAVWGWAKNQSPLPPLGLLQLAQRLGDFDEWETSTAVLRVAAKLRPGDFEIHRTLGWHLRQRGPAMDDEALEELTLALNLNPDDPETLGMIGGLHKRRGDFEAAQKSYQRANEVAPTSQYIQVNLAAMLVLMSPSAPTAGLKQYASILDRIERSAEGSSDPWSAVVAGEAAFALGKDASADKYFQRAKTLTKTGEELKSAASQLELFAKKGFRAREARALSAMIRGDSGQVLILSTAGATQAISLERVAPDTPVLLHLSDIHFGTKPVKDGVAEMHRFIEGDWEKSLQAHLAGEFNQKRGHFRLDHKRIILVVSGDLTYQATDQEFIRVQGFLEQLCGALSLPKERVFVVPGNHDVHWASANIERSHRFDNYLAFLHQFYGDELFRQRHPRVKWNLQINGIRPAPEDIVSVYKGDGFVIVGLNSCVYETQQDHYGFIGGKQLENVEALLDEIGGGVGDLRVAVLHHHLHPYPEPVSAKKKDEQIWTDLSTIRDAGLVERRLEKLGFDLVLHGHKHKPQLRESLVHEQSVGRPSSRLFICGAGSAGVSGAELEHQVANHYELIELLRTPRVQGADLLSIEWRELALQPGAEWVTSKRWVLAG